MYTLIVVQPTNLALLQAVDFQYQVQKPIQCFEYNFEYNVNMGLNFTCQVWSSGSWLQLRGRGNLDALEHVLASHDGVPFFEITDPFGSSGTATFTRSLIAGGIGGVLSF